MDVKKSVAGLVFIAGLSSAWVVADSSDWRPGMMGLVGGPGMMWDYGGGPHHGMQKGRGWGGGFMYGPERMSELLEDHLETLEKELGLKSSQKSAWEAFEQVAEAQVESMIKHHKRMSDFYQKSRLTLPERVSIHKEMMGERFSSMSAFSDAISLLYDQLSPEQQQVMDRYPIMGGM